MKALSYYMLLKPYFEKFVKAYKEDFTRDDRKLLNPRNGVKWAISGMRRCGTNLITDKCFEVTESKSITETLRYLKAAKLFMFEGGNDHFFICENDEVRKCSRSEAIEYFEKKFKKVCDQVAA